MQTENTHTFDMTVVREFLKKRARTAPTGIYEHHNICNRDKRNEVPHCKYCQINFVMTVLGELPRIIALFEGYYKYKNSGKRFFSCILVGEEIFPMSHVKKIRTALESYQGILLSYLLSGTHLSICKELLTI